jgi:D-lactate dehydrogenase
VNRLLRPFGYRLGPDPASLEAAMLGGIVANNASGMCCGVARNSYHTLESLRVLLADGTLVDSARPDASALLPARLHRGLVTLRERLRGDPPLAARVRAKFATKNTTGYSLQALLDHDDPAQILAHLMVGSQGTLGFLVDVTLRTVPEPALRGTALWFFSSLADAAALVPELAAAGVEALELLDAACLRALAIDVAGATSALLVEVVAGDEAELERVERRARATLGSVRPVDASDFTREPEARAALWRLRKGLLPAVGGRRPVGTAVVIEDVAVPVARLAEAIADLQALLQTHGYASTAIFGHAKDGNLHFVLAEDFGNAQAVARYGAFMRALVDLIVGRYDGALKAEHGSGRNMAAFVRDEWGAPAYALMRDIKTLLDPDGVLNPGVLLSDDPAAHLRDLKALPTVSPLVDRCIECGFCEPRCPSRDVTLSPRQRIVARRALVALPAAQAHTAAALEQGFDYEGLRTCVGDGMCATDCPVGIDTGALVKELVAARHSRVARRLAATASRSMGMTLGLARTGLRLAGALRRVPGGDGLLAGITQRLHARAPTVIPRLPKDLALPPAAAAARRLWARSDFHHGLLGPRGPRDTPVVYLPACPGRVFGSARESPAHALPTLVQEVLRAAGFVACLPPGAGALCCGLAFASKGHEDVAHALGMRALAALAAAAHATDGLAIVTDASPCASRLAMLARDECRGIEVLDLPAFWARHALPRLAPGGSHAGTFARVPGVTVLHPTCALRRAGGQPDLLRVAQAHAERVHVPVTAECCGFGGDRGFLVPEVTAAATRREAEEIRALGPDVSGCYSTCRTCEIGLARALGQPCDGLPELLHRSLGASRRQQA